MDNHFRSGYVALIGQPNVGKSTLLNQILGKKISITSRKPQTTRQRILGIKNTPESQVVYIDTPGIHQEMPRQMNRYMNRVARASLHDVDVVVFLVDAHGWNAKDDWVLKQLEGVEVPVILAVNKVDTMKHQEKLLPYLDYVQSKYPFYRMVPISAKNGDQVDVLEKDIMQCLKEGPAFYPADQFTDRSDRFVAAEILREKLLRFLGQELPYATTVTIDAYADEEDIIRMAATIWVEKAGQKAIVIGKGGLQLKKIGQAAREDMEAYFGKQVYIQTWVKIKTDWTDDQASLERFGFRDE